MPLKVNSVNIMDNSGVNPVHPLTDVLGWNVAKLNIRVELDGTRVRPDDIPDKVQVVVTARQPAPPEGVPGPKPQSPDPKSSMSSSFTTSATRDKFDLNAGLSDVPVLAYKVSHPLSDLAPFMKSEDTLLEVATVVRVGGTSHKEFLRPLVKAGWALRGSAVQPGKGKKDPTGDAAKEQPDAQTLFRAGGVEVLEVNVSPAPGLTLGGHARAWAFVRSPADVFFYSGHGAWWDCSLLHETGNRQNPYEPWLTSEQLLPAWRRQPALARSPMDLDVLIINGCSVIRPFRKLV
jgi:hypothetical protein